MEVQTQTSIMVSVVLVRDRIVFCLSAIELCVVKILTKLYVPRRFFLPRDTQYGGLDNRNAT